MAPREPLSRERIVAAAVAVADRSGLAGVSMRTVARELGVEAMSLYHHIAGKEALLDDLADHVFTLVPRPKAGRPWRPAMAARATAARAALGRHPWALGLIESRRAPGPALLAHHDAVLGCLRADGFSVALAVHAFSALDAYVYGFVLTEQNVPVDTEADVAEFVDGLDTDMAAYPHMAEMMAELVHGGTYVFAEEFAFGLDLVLDGIERHHRADG